MLDSVGGGFRGLGSAEAWTIINAADEKLDAAYLTLKREADAGSVEASIFAFFDAQRTDFLSRGIGFTESEPTLEEAQAYAQDVADFATRIGQVTGRAGLKRWLLIGGSVAVFGGLAWFIAVYAKERSK